MTNTTARKPHRDFVGYRAELRNKLSGGHNVILDCKWAEDDGTPIIEDYRAEGGRYQVLCNDHSTLVFTTSMPSARDCMKDATMFCDICRALAGECDPPTEAFERNAYDESLRKTGRVAA